MARLVTALALMLAVAPAAAAELRDPTRPPPGHGAEAGKAPAPAPARLTSVMLRPGGRSLAMVDGAAVRVGDRLAGGTVTAIDEGGLWLRTEAGPKRIELLPVVKTPPRDKNEAAKMEKKR